MLAAALFLLAGAARAEEPPAAAPVAPPAAEPASGLAFLLVGSGLLVAGGANLATAPLCEVVSMKPTARTPCVATSVAFGLAFVAAGIPLVVLGAHRRETWNRWHDQGPAIVPLATGAAVTWRWTW
jgi:hypothetical protein